MRNTQTGRTSTPPALIGSARLRAPGWVAALLLVGGGSLAASSTVTASEVAPHRVEAHTDPAADGKGVTVRFMATVSTPAASVLQALDDVLALPSWLPRMKATTRHETLPEEAPRFDTVLGLPWPIGEVHETMTVRREVDGETVRLYWDHVRGDMRRNEVVWTVTPIDAEHTQVRYDANLWFKSWLPVFLIRIAERDYAPWFVNCLERRAAALATAAAPPQNAAAIEGSPRL